MDRVFNPPPPYGGFPFEQYCSYEGAAVASAIFCQRRLNYMHLAHHRQLFQIHALAKPNPSLLQDSIIQNCGAAFIALASVHENGKQGGRRIHFAVFSSVFK